MTQTLLVTGASGFVGSACLRRLPDKELEVHATSRAHPGAVPDGVSFHTTDLLDPDAVAVLVRALRPTHLLHLAWVTTHGAYWEVVENHDWVDASRHVLRTFVEYGGMRAVVAGSCAEYDWTTPSPFRETESVIAPRTTYGRAKDELRRWAEEYATGSDLSLAWARLFHLYGPNEDPKRLVASVIQDLLVGRPARCTDGTQVRDYLHVDDAASALVALLGIEATGPVNVASGVGVSVRHVVERIADVMGRRDLLRFGAVATLATEPPEIVADVTRLRKEVGWRPALPLDVGLEQTVDWWTDRG